MSVSNLDLASNARGHSINGQGTLPLPPNPKREQKRAELFMTDNMIAGEDAHAIGQVHTVRAMLTPALAQILLDNNAENRTINKRNVEKIAQDIRSGRWVFNGEAIKVSLSGDNNDGQHRCLAVIEAGIAIDTLFVFGLPRESRVSLDQGIARTTAHYLAMEGYPNSASHAASVSTILKYHAGRSINDGATAPTKADIQQYVRDNIDTLQWAYHLSSGECKAVSHLCALSLMASAAVLILDATDRKTEVETFITSLISGENLGRDNPIFVARNKLISIKGRRTTQARLEAILKGWNAWITKKRIKTINCTGSLPEIEG